MAKRKIPGGKKNSIISRHKKGAKACDIAKEVGYTTDRINTVIKDYYFGKADDLWSKAVKGGGRCEVCRSSNGLESHHLIERKNLKYRWDINNGVSLCFRHHKAAHDTAAHGGNQATTSFIEDWLKESKPDQYKWFHAHRKDGKWDSWQWPDVKEAYERLKDV